MMRQDNLRSHFATPRGLTFKEIVSNFFQQLRTLHLRIAKRQGYDRYRPGGTLLCGG